MENKDGNMKRLSNLEDVSLLGYAMLKGLILLNTVEYVSYKTYIQRYWNNAR